MLFFTIQSSQKSLSIQEKCLNDFNKCSENSQFLQIINFQLSGNFQSLNEVIIKEQAIIQIQQQAKILKMHFQKSIYQQTNLAMIDAFYQLKQALIRYQQYFGDLDPINYQLWTHENGIQSLIIGTYQSTFLTTSKPSHEDKIYMETRISDRPMMFESSPSQKIEELQQKHLRKSELQNQIFHSDDQNCLQLQSILALEHSQNQGIFRSNEKHMPLKIEEHQKNERTNQKNFIRGPYKSYTKLEKISAVEMFNNKVPITKISKILKIPCKNIKRWAEQGIQRKKGAGRKRSDPQMEEQLAQWVFETYAISSDIAMEKIQQQALLFSHDKNFKASRGWLTKFLDRYAIRQHYRVI